MIKLADHHEELMHLFDTITREELQELLDKNGYNFEVIEIEQENDEYPNKTSN